MPSFGPKTPFSGVVGNGVFSPLQPSCPGLGVLRFRAPMRERERETQNPPDPKLLENCQKGPEMGHPQNYLEKSQKIQGNVFLRKSNFLVFFEFFPGNFGGGPFRVPFYREPLNTPFLNGLFSSGFSRGKMAL